MSNKRKLFWVKTIHTIIYLIMASACVFILMSGVLGWSSVLLYWAIVLIVVEGIVFGTNGMRCPLTDLAKKYGAEKGYAFDSFIPEKWSKYTFRFFGGIFLLGIILLVMRYFLG